MGRLIDESEAIELIKGSDELTDYQKDESITCIRACNTAYDPNEVVEQLEKKKQQHKRLCKYEKKNGTVTEEFQQRKAVEVLENAIEIVKAGDVKALSDTQQPATEKIIRELEEYYEENKGEENSGFILVCIDIVKETNRRMRDGKVN